MHYGITCFTIVLRSPFGLTACAPLLGVPSGAGLRPTYLLSDGRANHLGAGVAGGGPTGRAKMRVMWNLVSLLPAMERAGVGPPHRTPRGVTAWGTVPG